MTTGQTIKQARQAAGITQQELADRLGISYVGVSQWETDKRNPKQETLVRIAKALDIPVSSLCGPDRFIPASELIEKLSGMLKQANNNRESARRSGEYQEMIGWEHIAIELEQLKGQFSGPYSALSEDAEQLVEMFDCLNSKGRKKVLEWVGDFCKIPEYQAILAQPQQQSPQT